MGMEADPMSEFAEDLPYWKTSSSGPDAWLEKASREIGKAGGNILAEGFGNSNGDAAYMLRFEMDGSTYRIVWPCAKSKRGDTDNAFTKASRRQAATMLFHDVKAMCVKARALGSETAFFSHLELPGGKVASEMVGATGDLPKLLGAPQ